MDNTLTDEPKSDCEDSDDGLKIVIDSPEAKRKNRSKQVEISLNDKEIIDTVASDLEKTLEEKAAKANLTTSNVKDILKHVVTNEDVLAMLRQAEDPENEVNVLPLYEPKLTRAKAKELFPSQSVTNIPWITPTIPSSEVQVLISEELQEDSSDDEYIPADEESEDDKENAVPGDSEPQSVDLPTPKSADSVTQTQWSEDGVFKIPHMKVAENAEEEANIAKRTRSKLSLSSTPLEVIEGAFIPPDITTDMYDMDCDNDDWRDFLKTFTRPLDEVIKDDEDHDPEYNVLADEEIDKVDKEELRADKAVKVTRKELNILMAELFEYADNFTEQTQNQSTTNGESHAQFTIYEDGTVEQSSTTSVSVEMDSVLNDEDKIDEIMINDTQKILLEQQMRQHVQILTQNFILGYQHPEYFEVASKCKEYLHNLKCLSGNKTFSYFSPINLHPALSLIEYWENKFESNDQEVQDTKAYVTKVYYDCKTAMSIGKEYIPTFPLLVLQTISKSIVFLYTSLLPKIPFKPPINTAASKIIIKPETELIALGLEQFIPFLEEDPYHINKNGKVRMKHVCYYIQRYMMPIRDYLKIYRHVTLCRSLRSEPNPIQHYFLNNKAPLVVHYVVDLTHLEILSPSQRNAEQLPYQWKCYLYQNSQQQIPKSVVIPILSSNITKVKPPTYKNFLCKKKRILPKPANNAKSISRITSTAKKKIQFENESIRSFSEFKIKSKAASTPISKPRKLERYFKSPESTDKVNELNLFNLKFNSTIFKKLELKQILLTEDTMLPSMPSLSTPFKKSPERCTTPPIEESIILPSKVDEEVNLILADTRSNLEETGDDLGADGNQEILGKDNIEDINALMVASSTVKPVRKKNPTGAEKRKAKLKKDLNMSLSILSSEDVAQSEEKTNRYVQAFYDKLQERLDIHEYHRLIEILNNFEENHDSVVDLYKSVNDILSPKYADLTDEFLSFLTSSQAKAVGKLVPHIMINNMSLFLRKLEMYFKGQPFQVKKIYRSVTELADCVDITMDRVKSTILPLLKGNKLLIDWFLQIFPCESPTQSLLNGAWENIEVGKDNTFTSKDVYETITVPEVEDPYGGPNCICTCHNVEDQTFKSRSRHCIPCGTKFLQGRVYVHTGKGLKSAKITFDNSNIDHYKRLGYQSSVRHHKRRSEVSPSKHISQTEDAQDDPRMSNESEDDDCAKKKQQKLSKTPRKRRPKLKVKRDKKILEEQKVASVDTKPGTVKSDCIDNKKKKSDVDQIPENIGDSSINEPKPVTEEVMEWDCNTSIESIELKHSPELSAESESGETSQDNINTDSDYSTENIASPAHLHSENSNSNTGEEVSWTKEEDKIILETFRREGDKEETFHQISNLLENRSVSKVKSRFHTLLNIIQEMASKKVL